MELKAPTLEQLETVYDAHLKESFPVAELKPLRIIRRMLEDGYYRPWCLFDGSEIVGECFLWLGEPGWALLDYLCISPRRRNGGIERRCWKRCWRRSRIRSFWARARCRSTPRTPTWPGGGWDFMPAITPGWPDMIQRCSACPIKPCIGRATH